MTTIVSTHLQGAPNNTAFKSTEWSDGYVFTALVDLQGSEIAWAESYRLPTDPGVADAICRNQDTILLKKGWN